MKTTMMRMVGSMRACALAAVLVGGLMGVGPLAPSPAMAQVKSMADVKSLLKPELPAGALEVSAAMKSDKVGDTITVRGNVAMSKDAFVEKQSVFTLVDEATRKGDIPAADKLPETSDDIPAASKATVQVVDASGKPLSAALNGQHALKSGAEVFVTGTVETANGTDVLVLTVVFMHVPRAPLPNGFFIEKRPDNARDVSDVRKAGILKVGDEVVLRGRVGGSKEPFVSGRAVFTLMGHGLKACNENPDDNCAKPWDYCCETKADILANSVTVQVVEANGQILRTGMKGRNGIRELSEMVVVGKVVVAGDKTLLINGTAIAVVK